MQPLVEVLVVVARAGVKAVMPTIRRANLGACLPPGKFLPQEAYSSSERLQIRPEPSQCPFLNRNLTLTHSHHWMSQCLSRPISAAIDGTSDKGGGARGGTGDGGCTSRANVRRVRMKPLTKKCTIFRRRKFAINSGNSLGKVTTLNIFAAEKLGY